MKTLSLMLGILTGLMLISTLICGFWIKANKVTDISSIDFHIKLGSSSVIIGVITIIMLLTQIIRK